MKNKIVFFLIAGLIFHNSVVMSFASSFAGTSESQFQSTVFEFISFVQSPFRSMDDVLQAIPLSPGYQVASAGPCENNDLANCGNLSNSVKKDHFSFLLNLSNNFAGITNIQKYSPDVDIGKTGPPGICLVFILSSILIYMALLLKSNLPWKLFVLNLDARLCYRSRVFLLI